MYHFVYRSLLPARFWLADRFHSRDASGLPLPPARLRFCVSESTSIPVFFRVGQAASANIQRILEELGCPLRNLGDVLDFGCGRTLRWLRQRESVGIRWHASDTDQEAIRWCRENLPGIDFSVNSAMPPLKFGDQSFGLIYAISVFTHLDEDHQRAWLKELHRVLRRSGWLILTFYSEAVWRPLGLASEIGKNGFLFRTSAKLCGIQPKWYQTAFATPARLQEIVAEHFSDVRYIPSGFGSHDVIAARRQPGLHVRLLEGWHAVENDSFRWTAKQFSMEVALSEPATEFALKFFVPDRLYGSGPVGVSCTVSDQPSGSITCGSGTQEFRGRFPFGSGIYRLDFTIESAFQPGDDERQLGICIPMLDNSQRQIQRIPFRIS